MNIRKRIKKKLIDQKIPLFLFQKQIVILISFLFGFISILISSFMSGAATFHEKDFLLAVIGTFVFYSFCVYFHIKNSPYFEKRKNISKNRNSLTEVDVILSSSHEIGSWRLQYTANWISFFLAQEGACYQKCIFGKYGDFSEKDYFWYVLTKHRAEILTKLYSGEITYWDFGIYPKNLTLFSGVPLNVVYNSKNHFLEQLLPVDGYQYSFEELELINAFNESDSLGKKDINRRALVTYWGILLVLLPLAFVISLLAVLILKFFWGFVLNFGDIIPLLPLGVLFFLILYLFDFNRPVSSKKYRKDEDAQDYVSEDVFLTFSCVPQNTVNPIGLFKYIFREENVKCYELRYVAMQRKSAVRKNQEEWVYYILTNEKAALLRSFADIDTQFRFFVLCDSLDFKNSIPLKIIYGKHSRVLKSIAPAEGYNYTESQLAAIEKFNTLYP